MPARILVGKFILGKRRYPYPRCFVEVCQTKGDAGASVRKCVKTGEIQVECFAMVVGVVRRGVEAVSSVHAQLYHIGTILQWYS
jgi:hypothetical protein